MRKQKLGPSKEYIISELIKLHHKYDIAGNGGIADVILMNILWPLCGVSMEGGKYLGIEDKEIKVK